SGSAIFLREDHPPFWVEDVAKRCLADPEGSAMITGPLSKTLIKKVGLQDMGHTGILSRISKASKLYMAFYGQKFSVMLATGHVPLAKVSSELTIENLTTCLNEA